MGPSPQAIEAAREAVVGAQLYPDGGAFHLRRTLAEYHGIEPADLLFGAGSNEIIHMLVQAFCRPGIDQVLAHEKAFISYGLAARGHGVELVTTPTTDEQACDIDAFIAAMNPRTKVIFLANPNNPTGSYVPRAEFERILDAVPEQALLVVDEAYHEYSVAAADDYPRSQTYRRPNLLTLRSFSKIHGLAGLRVGYAIGDPRVLALLNRIRRPFNLNVVAQAAAAAALADEGHVEATRRITREGLEAITRTIEKIGLRTYPFLGNFVLVRVPGSGRDAYLALLQKGVIVRAMEPWGVPQHVRISAPRLEDLERVTTTIEEVLGS